MFIKTVIDSYDIAEDKVYVRNVYCQKGEVGIEKVRDIQAC